MSSTETANKFKIALLSRPYQKLMKDKLAKLPPRQVTLQINNDTKVVSNQQTVLQSALKDFKKKVPFNCRAGICGACEAKIFDEKTRKFEIQRICYVPVEDGMQVLTLDKAMQNFRQGTADE